MSRAFILFKLRKAIAVNVTCWRLAAACLAIPLHAAEHGPVRVCLIGDSTVAEYGDNTAAKGWGQYLQNYFPSSVTVANRAVGGRSSKSFQTEGRWRAVLKDTPDFVLIQFGHNDSHPAGLPESTEPFGEFRECLERYIRTARHGGIAPVLVTPVSTRTFNPNGKLGDPLSKYAVAMRQVAAEMRVPLVDLHLRSAQLFEKLGPELCAGLGPSAEDKIHFNELGAKGMAELVARELRLVEPRLGRMLKDGYSVLNQQLTTRR